MDSITSFADFGLDASILSAISTLGFTEPTPIQIGAIPALLAGKDVIGRARTGSGKTAAFALPLIENVKDGGNHPRILVLTPTRELAIQVSEAIQSYARGLRLEIATIYGGAAYGPQFASLKRGATIVVGTPGRVLDHVEKGSLDLSKLNALVLDEADEMLRMGFIEDVERVLEVAPENRQIALFSATMPPPIHRIATRYLRAPVMVQVETKEMSTGHIAQRQMVAPPKFKLDAVSRFLRAESREGTLVFARTRAGCGDAAEYLAREGFAVEALHGDLNQGARELVLARLKARRLDVVVATDVAARGLDVDHITHVINLDLPDDVETYVHRIGRTGRAGRKGVALSLVAPSESWKIKRFAKSLTVDIGVIEVPSDRTIATAARTRLAAELAGAESSPSAIRLIEDLRKLAPTEEGAAEVTDNEWLARALTVLCKDRALQLSDGSAEPPSWARTAMKARTERPADARPQFEGGDRPRGRDMDNGDMIELFLPVGKNRQIRPGDIVGAIANEFGIPGHLIGKVSVGEKQTFVGVPKEVGESLLAESAKIFLRGQEVPLVRSRVGGGAEARGPGAGPARPFRFNKGGDSKRGFDEPRAFVPSFEKPRRAPRQPTR